MIEESNSPGSSASCQPGDLACGYKCLLIWGPSAVLRSPAIIG